jgi:hypothetical protein
MCLLGGVLDVYVQEEQVRLTVDVFDGNLNAVKTSSFMQRDFLCKIAAVFLVDDAIRCCKKSQDVGDEVLLLLNFLIRTYIQKLHTIAKRAFSDWRNLNSPHGRFASEVSKAKHQLDYS